MKESLEKVLQAVSPLGYDVETDEPASSILIKMRCEKRATGPVLQAALATGAIIPETRASRRGYEIFVE